MKRELQLSDICCYLPYGLKAYYEYGNKTGVVSGLYDLPDNHDVKLRIDWSDSEHIWMYKPLLRPMSLLTSEITHKGETFVPLIEIFKLNFPYLDGEITINEVDCCWPTAKCGQLEIFYSGDLKGFDIIDGETNMVADNIISFDKLNEWFFDYRSLIDAGLAISVTDIKESVYE